MYEEQKDKGNAAFKAGQMADAVQAYSEAIRLCEASSELDGTQRKEATRTLYSNRSAAYHKLGRYEDALTDGKKCTTIDPQWGKGHGRTGDALYSLRKYTDAYNSYNAILRIDPNDASAQHNRDRAMKAIANENSRSQQHQQQYESSSSSNSRTTASGTLGKIEVYAKYLLLAAFVGYLIPFGSISRLAWRAFIFSAVGTTLISIYASIGPPRLSMEYVARAMQSSAGPNLFLCMLLLTSRPYFLAGLPLAITVGAGVVVESIRKTVPPGTRLDVSQLPAMVQPYLGGNLPQVQAAIDQISSLGGQRRLLDAADKLAATAEIYQGIFLVVELCLPTRNFMLLYLWWQYLMMRVVLERSTGRGGGVVKQAFTEVDAVIQKYLAYQIVPQIVRTGYDKLKHFMSAQVDQATTRSGGGGDGGAGGGAGGGLMGTLAGAARRCSVM